jgi:hypothetical protein
MPSLITLHYLSDAMSFLILTLLLAIQITACDYWSPTQSFDSSAVPRRPERVFLGDDTRFNESRHLTLPITNWPASAVDAIYFLPLNEATGYGTDAPDHRIYVFVRPSEVEPAMLCRDDGQAIDGFRSNPVFAEVCIVNGQITLRKKQDYSFKDNPVSLRIIPVVEKPYRRSEFLVTTGIRLTSDTSLRFEEGGVIRSLVNWPASAVDKIYLAPINEATDYGHRYDPDQWIYIFVRPSEPAVLCRDDGQAIDGFQPNPAFAEVCIVDGRITLHKKQDYSFKDNPAFLWVAPVPETPRSTDN